MMLTGPFASDTPVVVVRRSAVAMSSLFPCERWLMPGSVRVP